MAGSVSMAHPEISKDLSMVFSIICVDRLVKYMLIK